MANLRGSKEVKLTEAESIDRGMRDMRDGYTYPTACQHRKGICEGKMFVCHECAIEACDKWYRLGLRDGKIGRNRLEEP
jgi:hypothetical protein